MALHNSLILVGAFLLVTTFQKRITVDKAKTVLSHEEAAIPQEDAANAAFAAFKDARNTADEASAVAGEAIAAARLADAAVKLAPVTSPEKKSAVKNLAEAAEAFAGHPTETTKRDAVYAAASASELSAAKGRIAQVKGAAVRAYSKITCKVIGSNCPVLVEAVQEDSSALRSLPLVALLTVTAITL